jgi:MFS-type transporter involved in bile tolerance (Atg22 family)
MAFFGMAPFGALAAGALATRMGAPLTVLYGGVATLAAIVVYSIVRRE